MAAPVHSEASQVAARLASGIRNAARKRLTLDTTVRGILLSGGGYRLYGCATASWYAVRACDSSGTLLSTEAAAPSTSELAAPSAGTAGTGNAWPAGADTPVAATALQLPLSSEDFREISVKGSTYVVLYVRSTASVNADLEGPFEGQ